MVILTTQLQNAQLTTSSRIKKLLTPATMPLKRNIRYDADEEVGKAHKKLCNTSITGGEVGGGGDVHVEDIEMEANKQAALSN